MAVDIKTLRIGSHVEYEGKRIRLDRIDSSEIDNECAGILSWDFDYLDLYKKPRPIKSCPSFDERIQPIPITPELLKELGFKYRKSAGGSWCISDKKGGYFYATVASDNTCIVTHYPDFGRQSQVVCANLHEFETFVYLIAKTELIKD